MAGTGAAAASATNVAAASPPPAGPSAEREVRSRGGHRVYRGKRPRSPPPPASRPLDPALHAPPGREAACQASVCDAHRAGHPVPRQVSQEAESPKHGVAGRRMVWVLSNQGEWQLAPPLPNRTSSKSTSAPSASNPSRVSVSLESRFPTQTSSGVRSRRSKHAPSSSLQGWHRYFRPKRFQSGLWLWAPV